MADETVMTLHPDPTKRGVNISKAKYDVVRLAILKTLKERGEMTFTGLAQAVEADLAGRFEGSVAWYAVSVKLDLEARGELQRVSRGKKQYIRLAPGS